jgi:hypothetical protein
MNLLHAAQKAMEVSKDGIETYHGNYGAAAMLAAGAVLPGVAMVAEFGAASRAAHGLEVVAELGSKVGAEEERT